MDIFVVLIAAIIVLVVAIAGLVLVGRQLVASARESADADRDKTVRAMEQALGQNSQDTREAFNRAVGSVMTHTGEQLGSTLAAGSNEFGLRHESIDQQQKAMTEELVEVRKLVGELQKERAAQHGDVVAQLKDANETSQMLAKTTMGLREALASPKARGQWGERTAADVLRLAGFAEGVNFVAQRATKSGTIPDFTFFLPQDRVVHMDVKFPVDNYLRFLEDDGSQADTHRTAFLRDVRNRISELSGRNYVDAETTVAYVLLFIPNESVYSFIHEHEPKIVDVALGQKVVLCSPFTLFAVLAVIRQAMDTFMVERASHEILEGLAGFEEQWSKYCDATEKVGSNIERLQKSFEELNGPRRRQLQRSLDRVDDLRQHKGIGSDAEAELDLNAESPVVEAGALR